MSENTLNSLAERLNFIIEDRNLSHNDVARLCGIKQGSVSYIIAKGLKKSKLANEIADGLNISYEWLTKGIGSMTVQKAYPVPFFHSIYDAIKFYKNHFNGEVTHYLYSNQEILATEAFAIQCNPELTCICAFSESAQSQIGLYLNLTDILNDKLSISTEPDQQTSFPIIEIRMQPGTTVKKSLVNTFNSFI